MLENLSQLLKLVKLNKKRTIAVVAAEDEDIIEVVNRAHNMDIADFILIGDKDEIMRVASENHVSLEMHEVIHEPDHKLAAERAVQLVKEGKADALMKGLLHTSTFLKAILNKEKGLNLGRLISQISVLDKEDGKGLQMVTDCAMAIQPNLDEKKQIIENAIELAHKIGYECPKVAILSALEVVNPAINDTMDAAILSKMAERGQIKGAIIDGPLALDNAISREAAEHKGIKSPVAGQADIIVVPNLQVGNVLHKSLTYYAHKDIAAAVVGAGAPIIMTSRTDSIQNKLLTMALSCYIS